MISAAQYIPLGRTKNHDYNTCFILHLISGTARLPPTPFEIDQKLLEFLPVRFQRIYFLFQSFILLTAGCPGALQSIKALPLITDGLKQCTDSLGLLGPRAFRVGLLQRDKGGGSFQIGVYFSHPLDEKLLILGCQKCRQGPGCASAKDQKQTKTRQYAHTQRFSRRSIR